MTINMEEIAEMLAAPTLITDADLLDYWACQDWRARGRLKRWWDSLLLRKAPPETKNPCISKTFMVRTGLPPTAYRRASQERAGG